MDYNEATCLHQRAWEGMRESLGETHLETLFSLEDLSMSYVHLGPNVAVTGSHETELLRQSDQNMTFVYEQRKAQLGEEHPYTLLAILYLARLNSELGQHEEAERMICAGLQVADRNVGKDHLTVIMGKAIYAKILIELRRFDEAETIFRTIMDKTPYRKAADKVGDHPDRLWCLWLFAQCLESQGKSRELDVCEHLLESCKTIGGQGLGTKHKFFPEVQEKIACLQKKISEQIKAGAVPREGEGDTE
jgi:hypothetical protein